MLGRAPAQGVKRHLAGDERREYTAEQQRIAELVLQIGIDNSTLGRPFSPLRSATAPGVSSVFLMNH